MIDAEATLSCAHCGRPYIWPAWVQAWRVPESISDSQALCPGCRAAAAIAGLPPATIAPRPPWDGLPMRTATRSGVPGDPINLACEGSLAALSAAFSAIGARRADPLSLRDDLHLAEDALHHGSYLTAPVSRLFLFGRVEDVAFESELGSVARRVHVRFWDSGRLDEATAQPIFLGAISVDVGIELLRRDHVPIGTTHRIDPDLDAIRDLLVVVLIEAGLVGAALTLPGMGPTTDGRNGGGDPFVTDGQVLLVALKASG